MTYDKLVKKFDSLEACKWKHCKTEIDSLGGCSLFYRGLKIAYKSKEGRLFFTTACWFGLEPSWLLSQAIRIMYGDASFSYWTWSGTTGWDGTWREIITSKDGVLLAEQKYTG